MLCENRFTLQGSPSTCALDAGIIPFPSIILLILVPIYLLAQRRYNFKQYGNLSEPPSKVFPFWAHCIFVGLAVCLVGMHFLEVARLAAAHMGVGLLPFTILADITVVFVMCYPKLNFGMGPGRCVRVSSMLLFYWFVLAILEGIKVARLITYNQLNPAKGTAYPSSDWLLDNTVILGLYTVFVLAESVHLILIYRLTFLANTIPTQAGKPFEVHDLEASKDLLSYSTTGLR
ncbi:hypothetical protein SCHPADRAFT_940449 [Schizopora paradoxa]|uniref:Uncharacterized protein n=1 Tax=Schizopora paradoxa TaxID=27342 RepID=A0A0H2RNX7_9AGAM|nr:hypothetical protein SCHPADRAFT_940449 [Schizopora paradoxa]